MPTLRGTASASLCLGIVVRASDLIAAARAFHKLRPTLRAISLIRLRERRRTLAFGSGGQAPVGRLPEEVWAAIELRMVTVAVKEARSHIQGQQTCDECEDVAANGARAPLSFAPRQAEELSEAAKKAKRKKLAPFKASRKAYQASKVWDPEWVDCCEGGAESCQHRSAFESWPKWADEHYARRVSPAKWSARSTEN